MTEINAIEDAVQVEAEPKVGPGRDLREARESRNLTQEAVAKQLHIDISLVRALEEDDYGKIAAPIFVTGYLRAYARLLSLAPEPLVEAYQNLGAAAPPLERVARLSKQPESAGSAQVPRWVVSALAVAVVAVVIVIWRDEVTKLVASGGDIAPVTEGVPDIGGTMELPAQGDAESPQQFLPIPALPDDNRSQDTVDAPAAAVVVPSLPRPDLPRATLALSAEKPSWVEVKDRTGVRLFYDLMVPGDTQSLEGVPPFDILLGYAPGISVEYNGKRVDHAAYTRQDMARFRVGDKGAGRN